MPILYACLINQMKTIVVECKNTKKVGNYQEQVIAYFDHFVAFGQKNIPLDKDSSLLLHYFNQKDHTFCCIATFGDVTDLEANSFLKQMELEVNDCFTEKQI